MNILDLPAEIIQIIVDNPLCDALSRTILMRVNTKLNKAVKRSAAGVKNKQYRPNMFGSSSPWSSRNPRVYPRKRLPWVQVHTYANAVSGNRSHIMECLGANGCSVLVDGYMKHSL